MRSIFRLAGVALWAVLYGSCFTTLAAAAANTSYAHSNKRRAQLSFYAVGRAGQFINNEDDRARGEGANPFGNFKDIAPTQKTSTGPFAGDEEIFSDDIYFTPIQTQKLGAATFTCQYELSHLSFCDAEFRLAGGTLYAVGLFAYNARSFSLAVVGGSGKYAGSIGELDDTPGKNGSQHIVLKFH